MIVNITGITTIIILIPISVPALCSALGTYPVKSKAAPVKSAPIAEENLTINV